jgi:hypothetical protein
LTELLVSVDLLQPLFILPSRNPYIRSGGGKRAEAQYPSHQAFVII